MKKYFIFFLAFIGCNEHIVYKNHLYYIIVPGITETAENHERHVKYIEEKVLAAALSRLPSKGLSVEFRFPPKAIVSNSLPLEHSDIGQKNCIASLESALAQQMSDDKSQISDSFFIFHGFSQGSATVLNYLATYPDFIPQTAAIVLDGAVANANYVISYSTLGQKFLKEFNSEKNMFGILKFLIFWGLKLSEENLPFLMSTFTQYDPNEIQPLHSLDSILDKKINQKKAWLSKHLETKFFLSHNKYDPVNPVEGTHAIIDTIHGKLQYIYHEVDVLQSCHSALTLTDQIYPNNYINLIYHDLIDFTAHILHPLYKRDYFAKKFKPKNIQTFDSDTIKKVRNFIPEKNGSENSISYLNKGWLNTFKNLLVKKFLSEDFQCFKSKSVVPNKDTKDD